MASAVSNQIQFTAQFELQPHCREGTHRKMKMTLQASRYQGYLQDFFSIYTAGLTDFLYEFREPLIFSGTILSLDTFEEQFEDLYQLMKKLAESRREVKKLTDLSPDTYADTVGEGYSPEENRRQYLLSAKKACGSFQSNLETLKTFLKATGNLKAAFSTEEAALLVKRVERISTSLPESRKRKLEP